MNGVDVISTELQDLDILLDSEVTITRDVGESVFELYSSKYKKISVERPRKIPIPRT